MVSPGRRIMHKAVFSVIYYSICHLHATDGNSKLYSAHVSQMVVLNSNVTHPLGLLNDPNAFPVDGFSGSLVEFMVKETEKLHARVSTFKVSTGKYGIYMYFKNLLPRLVKEGDDGNCGSTAVCDTICLQALSKRIHYGKFVAEAKFRASPEDYTSAIKAQLRPKMADGFTYISNG
ncbi:chorismate mutase 1, chloroplastic-like isoform X1 [Impatiens glandulifera]|uniref:chorismate mutase 1, chloroplastic-like isoform X1 n=2 Tax=Impatiens glandulifera TaxID=253017 RepID=UPI001FB0CE63|nr:chorismate mutase 1, chloroplastic-like isoform X1 [Impatiens glandulifera]XP_047328995.1 chorismate mutase 1, chloroplastic-like isoform X1 [Impatiens glandulifera]XP_047339196.1 chorismate mutase 1, chloroplastic-like isoform X1 [Impatiens glandulifera]